MRNIIERWARQIAQGSLWGTSFTTPRAHVLRPLSPRWSSWAARVIPIHGVQYSSVSKGESLPDTIRSLQCYADVIVLRHPKMAPRPLAARYASKPSSAPETVRANTHSALWTSIISILNWAPLTAFVVAMVGRPEERTHRAPLARLLRLYDVRMTFVTPDILQGARPSSEAEMIAAGRCARNRPLPGVIRMPT